MCSQRVKIWVLLGISAVSFFKAYFQTLILKSGVLMSTFVGPFFSPVTAEKKCRGKKNLFFLRREPRLTALTELKEKKRVKEERNKKKTKKQFFFIL